MKKLLLMLMLSSTFLLCQSRSWSNLVYATKSSANKLDIYLPVSGNGPFPLIILIHGGAFLGGDKSGESSIAKYVIAKGYAAASINYRLSGEAIFPAQIFDVKAAIRFLKVNAATYLIDTSKVVVWGESAGGGLAALAGTSRGISFVEDMSMGNSSASSNVHAVVNLFGPINFLTMEGQENSLGIIGLDHDAATSPESLLFGGALQTKKDLNKMYDAETYISAEDPPFFIQHGTADNLVPYLQSKDLADKLILVIGADKVRYELINGAGHMGNQFFTNDNIDKILSFLNIFLNKNTAIQKENKNTLPTELKLNQNYPNPFNPETKISYNIPKAGYVKLIVYDSLGREIKVLVNEEFLAGYYEINFNPTNLASGIYFYQLSCNEKTITKKFILNK